MRKLSRNAVFNYVRAGDAFILFETLKDSLRCLKFRPYLSIDDPFKIRAGNVNRIYKAFFKIL